MLIRQLEQAAQKALELSTTSEHLKPDEADDAFERGETKAQGGVVFWEKHHVYTTIMFAPQHVQQQTGGYVELKFDKNDLRLKDPGDDMRTIVESCAIEDVFVTHTGLGITGACRVMCLDDDTAVIESVEHEPLDDWLAKVASTDARDDSVTLWSQWLANNREWCQALKQTGEAIINFAASPSNTALLMFMGYITVLGADHVSCAVESRTDTDQEACLLLEIVVKQSTLHLRSCNADDLCQATAIADSAGSDPVLLQSSAMTMDIAGFELHEHEAGSTLTYTRALESGDMSVLSAEYRTVSLPEFITYHDTPGLRAHRQYKAGMVGWHEAKVQAHVPTTFQAAGVGSLAFCASAHLRVAVTVWEKYLEPIEHSEAE